MYFKDVASRSLNERSAAWRRVLVLSKGVELCHEQLCIMNHQSQTGFDSELVTASCLRDLVMTSDAITLVFDASLTLSFYSPTALSIFDLHPADIGRSLPLIDAMTMDDSLTDDIRAVVASGLSVKRVVREGGKTDCLRCVVPCSDIFGIACGIVITISDLSAGCVCHVNSEQLLEETVVSVAADFGIAVVCVVDHDVATRATLSSALKNIGYSVREYADCQSFLDDDCHTGNDCLIVSLCRAEMQSAMLLRRLRESDRFLPLIFIDDENAVVVAVEAMKMGAMDFLERPIDLAALVDRVGQLLAQSKGAFLHSERHNSAIGKMNTLTPRQHQIMDLVLAGLPNKIIAADLHLSQRTVENHRAAVMKKTGSKSVPALARLALIAAPEDMD